MQPTNPHASEEDADPGPFTALEQVLDGKELPPKTRRDPLERLAGRLHRGEISCQEFVEWADLRLTGGKSEKRTKASGRMGEGRREAGAHATPWSLACWIADQVVGAGGSVLDPACGCGHLLVAAALTGRVGSDAGSYHGWDICPQRVAAARIGLWLATGRRGCIGDFCQVRVVDALLDAPEVRVGGIVANPPFVSIRALTRSRGRGYVQSLRTAYPGLTGNFDLYLPFLLRFREWLEKGGRYASIIPASFWSSQYSRRAREELWPNLRAVFRLSDRSVFPGASVSPEIIVGQAGGDRLLCSPKVFRLIPSDQGYRSELAEGTVHAFGPPAASHKSASGSHLATALGEVAEVQAGTPGYQARTISQALMESGSSANEPDTLPFVVSGCIDPYRLRAVPLRFMGRRWTSPVLPLRVLTAGKRELYESPKVLVAGVSRGLEAAFDDRGRALGVSIYAIRSPLVRWECLLALLNSPAMACWYRRRFAGKELSGGYFGVNRSSLVEIPIPDAWLANPEATEEVSHLVRQRCLVESGPQVADLDRQIAGIVEDLLGSVLL
ncbi:MAG: N-6 DNA methylase [Bradymonadales bacterium]|nr:N-6 DNA methylase [Bradymonadales bacterium]